MSCLLVELIEMHKVDLATAISTYFFVLILDLFYQNLLLSGWLGGRNMLSRKLLRKRDFVWIILSVVIYYLFFQFFSWYHETMEQFRAANPCYQSCYARFPC